MPELFEWLIYAKKERKNNKKDKSEKTDCNMIVITILNKWDY